MSSFVFFWGSVPFLMKKETLIRSLNYPSICLLRDFISDMLGDIELKFKSHIQMIF